MATTAQQIIDRSVKRSSLNTDDLVPDTEVLAWITSLERTLYLDAARENPDFFGAEGSTSTRSSASDSWDLTVSPGGVAAVSRVEVSSINGSMSSVAVGDEVSIVSIRQPQVGLPPRAYLRGRTIYEYESELQDDGSNYVDQLKVFYSELPSAITATSQSLTLPDEWTDFIVSEIASRLALRDGREQESELLSNEADQTRQLFLQQVSVFDEGTVRPVKGIASSSAAGASRVTSNG